MFKKRKKWVSKRGGWQGCWRRDDEEGWTTDGEQAHGSGWIMTSQIPPPCLWADLVRSASDNKAAHSNPARGSYLGSDHWAALRKRRVHVAEIVWASGEGGQKRPKNALARFCRTKKMEMAWARDGHSASRHSYLSAALSQQVKPGHKWVSPTRTCIWQAYNSTYASVSPFSPKDETVTFAEGMMKMARRRRRMKTCLSHRKWWG